MAEAGLVRVLYDELFDDAAIDSCLIPKALVGLKAHQARAIIGSSNLTQGGFTHHTELNVYCEAPDIVAPISDLLQFIDEQWESPTAFSPDAGWLDDYERSAKGATRVVVKLPEHLDRTLHTTPPIPKTPNEYSMAHTSLSNDHVSDAETRTTPPPEPQKHPPAQTNLEADG